MQIIKVKIEKKVLGLAIGKNLIGKTVFVINGDLINKTEIESVLIEKKGERLITEIIETYQNDKVLHDKLDNDNLISTLFIDKVLRHNIFLMDNKWFFPDNRIKGLLDYLLNESELWSNSKIHLTSKRSSYLRAKTFGITFQKAIKKLHNSGFSKARLFCEKRQDFKKNGVIAEMLANTYTDKEGFITLEVWQGVENVNEVFYAHGIMNKEKDSFTHFDCAIINYKINDKNLLFSQNKKIKSGQYKKLFRIDGVIETVHIFELANRFFPLDNLIDEYFEIERI